MQITNVTNSSRSTSFWYSAHSVCLMFTVGASLATLGLTALWQHGLLQKNLFHSREFSEKTEDPKIHRKCYHFFIHISVLFITVFVWERKIPFFHSTPYLFIIIIIILIYCKIKILKNYYHHCEFIGS